MTKIVKNEKKSKILRSSKNENGVSLAQQIFISAAENSISATITFENSKMRFCMNIAYNNAAYVKNIMK